LTERRHVILQAFEVTCQRGPDDVRSGGEKLSQFHVARSEPRQRRRQPGFGRAGRAPLQQPRHPQQRPRADRRHHWIDHAENALAGEHETGAAEPHEMRGS
jgi:hypothetical protein